MKADAVSAAKSAIAAGQDAVLTEQLGVVYDTGAADQKGIDGSFTQDDIDKAKADQKAVDDQALHRPGLILTKIRLLIPLAVNRFHGDAFGGCVGLAIFRGLPRGRGACAE